MKKKTAKALERAITHWEENLRLAESGTLTVLYITGRMCALCTRFMKDNDCRRGEEKCPVYERTGNPACLESPWNKVHDAIYGYGNEPLPAAVKEEIEFLRSLRESEK